MSNFRPTDRQTGFLMPPSVDEWLPQRHLARFVVEVVDGLDLKAMCNLAASLPLESPASRAVRRHVPVSCLLSARDHQAESHARNRSTSRAYRYIIPSNPRIATLSSLKND